MIEISLLAVRAGGGCFSSEMVLETCQTTAVAAPPSPSIARPDRPLVFYSGNLLSSLISSPSLWAQFLLSPKPVLSIILRSQSAHFVPRWEHRSLGTSPELHIRAEVFSIEGEVGEQRVKVYSIHLYIFTSLQIAIKNAGNGVFKGVEFAKTVPHF